jgi:polyisoprenoid-binding protein YceI
LLVALGDSADGPPAMMRSVQDGGHDVSDEKTATRIIGGIEAPAPGRWEIDPAHTAIAFVAKYLMVTKVRGHFSEFSGFVEVAERPEDSTAEITIKSASIDTGTADRDKHLRSADFLDVEHFPELRFRSTSVEFPGEDRITVTGDLTIRDVTQSVVLDSEFSGMSQDPWGNARAGYSARTQINREDFGASWNLALEAGGWLVSKSVQIELDVLTTLKKEESSS